MADLEFSPRLAPTPAQAHREFGSAVTLAIQLSHFEQYGLRDRIAYHLELLRDGRQWSSDGVLSILECVSTKPFHKFDKAQRRLFKRALKKLSIPFRVSAQTRVYFAYETTRMAFVLDASPTVTSTFGFSSHSSSCCPIDGLIPMARDYFRALIRDVPCQNRTWSPEISVTVVAVYPRDPNQRPTSLLVRDYRIVDSASAELLIEKMDEWCSGEVESEIAKRLSVSNGILPVNASSMHDLLDAGQAALASLSSASRPCIVIATDCRSLACDSIIDVIAEVDRVDIPVSVLDLSPPRNTVEKENSRPPMMNDDPTGAIFPLHLSDDSEFVVRVCQATNGAYWNASLLSQAAKTNAGNVPVSSALNRDHFFTFKRHTLCANAVQWYTLLELSPLSPVPQQEWGRLNMNLSRPQRRGLQARTMLQSYEINPAPLHDILLLRVKQGYRAKQCGLGETDRFSIHLTLQLDLGTTIHYELSYRSVHPLFGIAQVKMELSGDSNFVLVVKNDFLRNRNIRPVTMTQHVSAKLCAHAVGVRKEDLLQAYLSPTKWTEQFTSPDTGFLQKLASLSNSQYCRHFSRDEFECVCHGRMPWEDDKVVETEDSAGELLSCIRRWCTQQVLEDLLVKQIDQNCGIGGYVVLKIQRCVFASRLFTIGIASFAGTNAKRRQQVITALKTEIQKLNSVEILPKQMGQYLVGHRSPGKPEEGFSTDPFVRILESQYSHESWDLVKDVELIPLVMRRRKEVGKFILLESNEKHTLFAKLMGCDGEESPKDPGTHVQYKLSVLDDKVVADLHMEFESQLFFPLRQHNSKFHELHRTLRTREKECARALQCRTLVLRTIETDDGHVMSDVILGDSLASCVRRLLTYASVTTIPLRFFGARNEAGNRCLRELTVKGLMAPISGSKVAAIAVRDGGTGDWFAVQHNKETLSLAHLSQLSTIDDGIPVVRLDIHTISLDQMYRKHDDAERESTDGGIYDGTTHPHVASFREDVESAHKRHFSKAAYLTLLTENRHFDANDFDEALNALEFVRVAEVSIPGEKYSQRSLSQILAKVLIPVADVPGLFVFKRTNDIGGWSYHDQHDDRFDVLSFDETKSTENDIPTEASFEDTDQDSFDFDTQSLSSTEEEKKELDVPPIFVRFLKDEQLVDASELAVAVNSAKISVLVSVFSSSNILFLPREWRKVTRSMLPRTHVEAAYQISTLFHAYSAEQTLERLRAYGPEIEQSNIDIARSCLRKARKVFSMTVDVYFYSIQSDSMVRSYSLSVGDTGVGEGFGLVVEYLEKHKGSQTIIRCGSGDSFIAIETNDSSLCYWLFLTMDKIRGVVLIDLWHPGGEGMANRVMDKTIDLVAEACHRVNQCILLRHLHQSRCASELLVASLPATPVNSLTGEFGCEVVHRESLDLYHRCAANVNQVIRTLESSVLHNFAVSNRRSLFVYKDESENVFYIYLHPQLCEKESSIELLVYGIETPGPSIQCQLVNLLKRRLLTIGVDFLASVLTIKPLYSWKGDDVHFVSSFEQNWKAVEETAVGPQPSGVAPKERLYAFPDFIYDPGLVLLYFRQNILGSSYFYPVTTVEDSAENGERMSTFTEDNLLWFSGAKLVLYFNASRSKLNPSMQSENTLTERGANLARKAGSGLALVTISFESNDPMRMALLSPPTEDGTHFEYGSSRLQHLDSQTGQTEKLLRVTITDTSLDREALHDFVELCFNQVIVAWMIERHLDRMRQFQQFKIPETMQDSSLSKTSKYQRLVPGLPYLASILESSNSLPHPAIQIVEMKGVVRSSSVVSCLNELLRTILDEFSAENKQAIRQPRIIRASRDGHVSVVRLETFSNMKVQARPIDDDAVPNDLFIDSPIDCPEYTVYAELPGLPKVFNEVAVTMTDASNSTIATYKEMHPTRFRRSFAFILVVKRNLRKLYAYNWNAQLVKQVSLKLHEIEKANLWRARKMTETSLSECLGMLAPNKSFATSKHPRKRMNDLSETLSLASESDKEKETVQFRSKKNQPIRRPKLVGKSVDGSAAKAVAMSRARARFKPQFQSTNKLPPTAGSIGSASSIKYENASKDSQSKEPSSLPNKEAKGCLHLQRKMDAKTNRLQNDSVASSRCAFYQLINSSVFNRDTKEVPTTTANFLFQSGSSYWVEVADSPQLPPGADTEFLQACALLLCKSMPKLTILKTENSSSVSIIYLQSKQRSLSQCKCFELIRLKAEKLSRGRWRLVAEGSVLRVNRPPLQRRRFIWQNLHERDGGAFKILASKRRIHFCLKPQIFDCAMIRLANSFVVPTEALLERVLNTLDSLVDGYKLQPIAMRSAYKCFKLELKLSSYEDPMISLFTSARLMEWLYEKASTRGLHRCSTRGLFFRRELIVNSTISMFIITFDPVKSNDVVYASVLCDTKHKDIECLVKREDFDFMVTTFDLIAFEIAGAVHKELLFAARAIRQAELWETLSSVTADKRQKPTLDDCSEALRLCYTQSVLDLLSNEDKLNFISLTDQCVPNRKIQQKMTENDSFTPHWIFEWQDGATTDMFYMEAEGLFLLLSSNSGRSSYGVLVLDREPVFGNGPRVVAALHKISNFMLHWLWNDIVSSCP